MTTVEKIVQSPNDRLFDKFPEFRATLASSFTDLLTKGESFVHLFRVDAPDLFDIFLANLSDDARQHYNCDCCRSFVNRYGGLVTINGTTGETTSALWNIEVPEAFAKSVKALRERVEKANIQRIFVTKEKNLGTPENKAFLKPENIWTHMYLSMPDGYGYDSTEETPNQFMSRLKQDHGLLSKTLHEYPLKTLQTAVDLLESDTMYRSDRVLGVAKWLLNTSIRVNGLVDFARGNKKGLIWHIITEVEGTGLSHAGSSIIGTLLDDINDPAIDFATATARFESKMATYMESQVDPSAGGIKEAEKLIKQLGMEKSLGRNFAKIDDIPEEERLWSAGDVISTEILVEKKEEEGGVFGHIKAKDETEVVVRDEVIPAKTMTFEKFTNTILPTAESIEVLTNKPGRMMAMVVASDKTAPNILSWKNPLSWYYHGGIDGEFKRRVESAGGKYENNEIRCSLIWEGYTDLDLHCHVPGGGHINHANRRVGSGELDIDMNGMSHRNAHPVENIRFPVDAPEGKYTFFNHNYISREGGLSFVSATPFTAELEINGRSYTIEGVAGSTGWQGVLFEFVYKKGQHPEIITKHKLTESTSGNSWNIPTNEFVKVNTIAKSPNLWGENPDPKCGVHTFFILEDCKDTTEGMGRGFYVETLKGKLQKIRKVLNAFTKNTPIQGLDEASACGVGFSKDVDWDLTLRVKTGSVTKLIKIDRFD